MEHSINTSFAVIVLGDRETAERPDLAEKAAEKGATIVETYFFDPGQAVSQDDITEVEAVVTALARAIATRTDVWVPFPMPDLGREAHLRRVSLVLQRHGLNMLMGRQLEACALEGGFNEIDFALRAEVKAVDELDHAVVAAGAVTTLEAELTQMLRDNPPAAAPHRRPVAAPVTCEPPDMPVGERCYTTGEVARFFGKSTQWVSKAMRDGVFTDADGAPIEPIRTGRNGHRRFTVAMLSDMAHACYRRGILDENELLDLLVVLSRA